MNAIHCKVAQEDCSECPVGHNMWVSRASERCKPAACMPSSGGTTWTRTARSAFLSIGKSLSWPIAIPPLCYNTAPLLPLRGHRGVVTSTGGEGQVWDVPDNGSEQSLQFKRAGFARRLATVQPAQRLRVTEFKSAPPHDLFLWHI